MAVTATRRAGTWLLLAALVGLAIAAGVDAVRGQAERGGTARGRAGTPAVATQLRAAGVEGVLTYSDERCRLHALRLPALRPATAPAAESCQPRAPSGGITTWKGDVVWSGLGFQTVQVVFSQEELSRTLRQHGWPGGFRAVQAVLLRGPRYGVLAESAYLPRERILVGLQRERLRFLLERWRIGGADAIRPSPRGRYVAVVDSGGAGVRVFTREGRELRLPPVPPAHAIAWSPDERWTALATGWSVHVFRTEQPEDTVLRLPIRVRDLAWGA